MATLLNNYQSDLKRIAKEHKLSYMALYGSYARGEATPESDVDLMIEFEEGTSKSLLDLVRLQQRLSDLLQKKVDLVTKNSLDRYIKPYIQDDIQVIYEKKS